MSAPMERWLKFAAWGVVAVAVLSVLNFALAIHPFRLVSEQTPEDHGVEYEPVRFETRDGLELAGWYVPAKVETGQTVVIGHGYPYDKGDVLSSTLFLHERFNLLYYDHRYFGESEGRVTTIGLRETLDVEAALDHLEERGVGPIMGFGFSMSAAVMLMTEDERLEVLVAEAPYARLDLMVEEQYRFLVGPLKWPFTGMTSVYSKLFFGAWPSEVSPMDAARETTRPTLLIHGTADDEVPFSHAEQIMEGASDSVELWAVANGRHGGIRHDLRSDYNGRVIEFFTTHLEAADATESGPDGNHSSTGSFSGPATTLPSSSRTWITSTGHPSAAASASSSWSSVISFSQISPFCSPPSRSALFSSEFSIQVSGSAATQIKNPSQFSRS